MWNHLLSKGSNMLVWDDHTKLSFPSCHCTSLKGAPSITMWSQEYIHMGVPSNILWHYYHESKITVHPTTGILKMCRFHPSTSTCMLNFSYSYHLSAPAASGPSIIDDAGICVKCRTLSRPNTLIDAEQYDWQDRCLIKDLVRPTHLKRNHSKQEII